MLSRETLSIKPSLIRQRGLSLVELMIAVAIGMFLLLGLSTLLVANSQTHQELNKTGNQIENGRYAMQLLTDDVRLAGFLGTYYPAAVTWSVPDPCTVALANLGFSNVAPITVPVAIYGYTGSEVLPVTCAALVTNRLAGTDALVVRRVSTTPFAQASVPVGIFLQSSTCPDATIDLVPFIIATDKANLILRKNDCLDANRAPARRYMVRIYYVSSCNDCPNDTIPTLKVVEFNDAGALVTLPLVEGIQNMQLDYGIDMNNDGSVDCYTSNPTSPPAAEIAPAVCPQLVAPAAPYVWTDATANWSNVMTVRFNLLARNLDPTTGWQDTRTYNMGLAGATTATGDPYKRHAYSSVARLYNISGQRER